MFGTEGEFEKDDCEGALKVVKQHPPCDALVKDSGFGFVENEVEDAPSGFNAGVGEATVSVLGRVGLVSHALVDAAKAGSVDDSASTVEQDKQCYSARFYLGICRLDSSPKHWL